MFGAFRALHHCSVCKLMTVVLDNIERKSLSVHMLLCIAGLGPVLIFTKCVMCRWCQETAFSLRLTKESCPLSYLPFDIICPCHRLRARANVDMDIPAVCVLCGHEKLEPLPTLPALIYMHH